MACVFKLTGCYIDEAGQTLIYQDKKPKTLGC